MTSSTPEAILGLFLSLGPLRKTHRLMDLGSFCIFIYRIAVKSSISTNVVDSENSTFKQKNAKLKKGFLDSKHSHRKTRATAQSVPSPSGRLSLRSPLAGVGLTSLVASSCIEIEFVFS